MAKRSTHSGKANSATGSTASQTSRGESWVVSKRLTESEIDSLRHQSKFVNVVSTLARPKMGPSSQHREYHVAKDQFFVERRAQGDYAVRRGGAERASAVLPTQAEAIARAKELNPSLSPLVERVRNSGASRVDKWRRA